MKLTEIKHLIKEILTEEFDFSQDKKKGSGRRFIPQVVTIPSKVKDQFKEHFRLLKNNDGEYKLYITPILKDALESLTRGRTSRDTEKKLSPLAKMVSERMPQDVRAILKKNSEKMNPGLKMFSINTKIKEVNPNGDIVFYNPSNKATASQAFDPTISEDK
jgi:hypothetical protein